MAKPTTLTELLAPARDYETAVAAIDYGADAVYMGAPRFGARHAAGNSVEDIRRAVEYAGRYGARVYATLNTILFENELEQAKIQAEEVISAGADALIIQDMAYMEMGLAGVEFHASTQTFNATPEKVKFLREAGFSRVILERNLTLEEIKAIRRETDVELEVFVHGAICVCHSGRCYMSRTMSPRSGNRGECSQPCRLTYDLLDADMKTLAEGKHFLSVRDLDLSGRIGDLLDAGVTSFKIEGRLKDVNYVKNSVAHYRRRIDEELSKRPGFRKSSAGTAVYDFDPDPSKTFTRGRSEYFFGGKKTGVASFDTPKAIGEPVGKVTASGKTWIETDAPTNLSNGDGICFVTGGELLGANVNRTEGKKVFLNKESSITPGTVIYRNYDRSFASKLEGSRTRRLIDANAKVETGKDGLKLVFTDEEGITATAAREIKAEPASDPRKAAENLAAQVRKSGDTIFRINNIEISKSSDAVPFIPMSVINALRREGLEKLLATRLSLPQRRVYAEKDEASPYPSPEIGPSENVTNSLAEKFYRRHGASEIAAGLDTKDTLHGETVMRTPYCIRRETGRCAKNSPDSNTDLFLRRGTHLYRLRFDCRNCVMEVIFENRLQQ